MTLTVGLLPDHKGITVPKAVGDEYVVDAHVKISVYHTADVVTAAALGLKTITAAIITGQSKPDIEGETGVFIGAGLGTGVYESNTSMKLVLYNNDGDCQELVNAANIDDLTIRLRVWGRL